MRQHIDEVDDEHVQVVVLAFVVALHKLVGTRRVVHLVVAETVFLSESVQLGLNQRLLVQVLAFLLVFIHPEFREHLCNLVRHQSAEDGISGILRGGRQDAHIHILLHVEAVADVLGEHLPLVVSEVVDNDEENLFSLVEHRKELGLEDVGTHHRFALHGFSYVFRIYPVQIVLGYVFGKAVVGFLLLHGKHFGHAAVGIAQLQFPFHQSLIHFHPVLAVAAIHHLHGYLLIVLLVSALCHLGNDVLSVDILLERQ